MHEIKRYCFVVCVLFLIIQLPACTTLKQKAQTFIAPPMSFEEAQDFERRHLKLAQKLIEKDEWLKALDVYHEALKRLPHSEAIQAALKNTYQKNSNYIEGLTRKLTISRGFWLDENQHLYESLAKAEIKGRKAKYKNRAIKNEVKLISKQLTHYGNQTGNTKYLLDLAKQLETTKQNKEIITENSNQTVIRSIPKVKKDSRQIKLKKLVASYQQSYDNKKLQLAYQYINKASNLAPHNQKIQLKKTALAKEIETRVEQHLSDGLQFYSDGNYESALDSWQETLKLNSNNEEALNNIERTNKILANLSRIKEKQEDLSE